MKAEVFEVGIGLCALLAVFVKTDAWTAEVDGVNTRNVDHLIGIESCVALYLCPQRVLRRGAGAYHGKKKANDIEFLHSMLFLDEFHGFVAILQDVDTLGERR